jgi:hypothetical protein
MSHTSGRTRSPYHALTLMRNSYDICRFLWLS